MSQGREKRPAGETGRPEISWGDNSRIPQGTPNLRELDDALPFGPSLYADVPDMDAFIRLTIRNAAAHIDVKKHRAAVKV